MRRVTPKKPAYMEGEATMLSQCPECLMVEIKYAGDKYGPRHQSSIAIFENLKKKKCPGCAQKAA